MPKDKRQNVFKNAFNLISMWYRSLYRTGFNIVQCVVRPSRVPACCSHYTTSSDVDDTWDVMAEEELNAEIDSIKTVCGMPSLGHHILAIQPNIRYGQHKVTTKKALIQLDEAVALLQTLQHWRVVDKRLINCDGKKSKYIFRTGNFQDLVSEVRGRRDVSAVFVGVDVLSGAQKMALEQALGVTVYDRYSIVLEIFREHAKSRVAKLQVALAQIPYVRSRISSMGQVLTAGSCDRYIGGSGESYISKQMNFLQDREKKLHKILAKVQHDRMMMRESRKRSKFPTVAVVGYTNCGKSSVIQALTHDETIVAKDQLFATVDVTAHKGTLGAGHMDVLYIDTVGFISDIPTTLIESFAATLEDAVQADILLHVTDISHISHLEQREHVLATLQQLNTPNTDTNMMEVFNKVDKLHHTHSLEDGRHYISALHGSGMEDLKDLLERKILQVLNRGTCRLRIPIAGPHLSWLYKHASVVATDVGDKSGRFYITTVVIGEVELLKFKQRFGDLVV